MPSCLVTTFLLTVLIDLTVAVQVGVLLSALLFMKHMADSTMVQTCRHVIHENLDEHPELPDSDLIFRKDVPDKTSIFEITGPFFFAVAEQLNEALKQMDKDSNVFILRMRKVPIIDASGIHALKQFKKKCSQKGIRLMISGLRDPLKRILERTGVVNIIGPDNFFPNLDNALSHLKEEKN